MKRRAIPAVPIVNECPQCTTPSKCRRVDLAGKRGTNCIGRADGPDKCDCLNQCGDDPWLKTGRALPCSATAASGVLVDAPTLSDKAMALVHRIGLARFDEGYGDGRRNAGDRNSAREVAERLEGELRALLKLNDTAGVGINGLTEAETSATASVFGLGRVGVSRPDDQTKRLSGTDAHG